MENKQTAVEWFAQKDTELTISFLEGNLSQIQITIEKFKCLQQAKEMDKEQHGKTWDDAITQFIARGFNSQRTVCDFDEYYAGNYE